MAPLRISFCPGATGGLRHFRTDPSTEMHGIIETFIETVFLTPYTPAGHQWVTARSRVCRVSERLVYLLGIFPHLTHQQATKIMRPEWEYVGCQKLNRK